MVLKRVSTAFWKTVGKIWETISVKVVLAANQTQMIANPANWISVFLILA